MLTLSGGDIAAMDSRYRAAFINGLSGLRPAQLIGTVGADGEHNLAIFNSVCHVGAHPPLLGIISRPNSVSRHTLENITATGCYTINHVTEAFFKAAHQTSARYDGSEFDAVGLTAIKGSLSAPYVAESPLSIGLQHKQTIDLDINGTHFVIGEVVEVRVQEDAIAEDGAIDLHRIGSISVGGLDHYYRVSSIARMSYAKPDKPLERLDSGD